MRKLNVDRMRNYIYKNTPDRIVGHFDLFSNNIQQEQQVWLAEFTKRMSIKHGKGTQVKVWLDDGLGFQPGDTVVVAEARPNPRR